MKTHKRKNNNGEFDDQDDMFNSQNNNAETHYSKILKYKKYIAQIFSIKATFRSEWFAKQKK